MKAEGGPIDGQEVRDVPSMLYQVPEYRLSDWDVMDPRTRLGPFLSMPSFYDMNGDPTDWIVDHMYKRDGNRWVWDHVTPDPPHWVGPMPPLPRSE